jgi:methylated-DNA-[protein]-cysteine S-methyltransferase
MKQIHISYYKKNAVEYILGSYDKKLCLVESLTGKNRRRVESRLKKELNAEYVECEDAILLQTAQKLDEYFEGKRKSFDIPLLMVGTDFQKSVWEALLKIPYGQTSTYKTQAKMIDNEKAVRAVANANGVNAISIIIPCHRIIGSDGSLTGYAGGLELKQRLLDIEYKHN